MRWRPSRRFDAVTSLPWRRSIEAEPALAGSRLGVAGGRTPLHIVSDWPGYFPNGPAVVALLVGAGANPNARSDDDEHGETPLHWTASSDDVDVALALIEGGADLEARDGSIGTPLDNAIGYGCWHVARLLVARGARVDKLWQAAALGMLDQREDLIRPGIDPAQISQAFWHACAGGQRRTAERLLSTGADLNWVPDYARRNGTGRRHRPRDSRAEHDRLAALQGCPLGSHADLSSSAPPSCVSPDAGTEACASVQECHPTGGWRPISA